MPTTSDKLATRLKDWREAHPGIIRKVALQSGVSHVYVSDILHGKRPGAVGKGLVVRRNLRKAGAPGFEVSV